MISTFNYLDYCVVIVYVYLSVFCNCYFVPLCIKNRNLCIILPAFYEIPVILIVWLGIEIGAITKGSLLPIAIA